MIFASDSSISVSLFMCHPKHGRGKHNLRFFLTLARTRFERVEQGERAEASLALTWLRHPGRTRADWYLRQSQHPVLAVASVSPLNFVFLHPLPTLNIVLRLLTLIVRIHHRVSASSQSLYLRSALTDSFS
jgi:hypothetical protein